MSVAAAIKVTHNAPEVAAALRHFARDQLPFASALALTRLAARVRELARVQLRQRFDVRSTWVVNRLSSDLTRKNEWPTPTVRVGHEYKPFEGHEVGETKKPAPGQQFVFVPTRVVASQRTSSGIPPPLRPSSLLRRKLAHVAEVPGIGRALVLNERVGRNARKRVRWGARKINRTGFTATGSARVLFLARQSVRIEPRFGFEKLAETVVVHRYPAIFVEALRFAEATRRPR